MAIHVHLYEDEFKEQQHPRSKGGEFTKKGVEQHELPYEKNPKIGWWQKGSYVNLYHGTHERNLPSIIESGISKPDPKTGMISMALEPNTAHGYASMSGRGGEAHFRRSGANVKYTPHEERVVAQYKIPREWINTNVDPRLGGNLGEMTNRMRSEEEYNKWVRENGPNRDPEYYGTGELRFNSPIPPEFFQGYMRKQKR